MSGQATILPAKAGVPGPLPTPWADLVNEVRASNAALEKAQANLDAFLIACQFLIDEGRGRGGNLPTTAPEAVLRWLKVLRAKHRTPGVQRAD